MTIEKFALILGLVVTLSGLLYSLANNVWKAYSLLEKRFDTLEKIQNEQIHSIEKSVLSLNNKIDKLHYKIEQGHVSRIQIATNTEANIYRLNNAVMALSGALAKYTDYSPRGQNGYPIDDEPTFIRDKKLS
jgi:uncharacterized protein YlxW (UPF0749 family)